jgi:CheY-like chemotaxis protein
MPQLSVRNAEHSSEANELAEGVGMCAHPTPAGKQVPDSRRSLFTDLPGGKETILLVEDEDAVRELLGRVLEKLGYTVLEAASGLAACALLSADSAPQVDLLMSDVNMPQMGGKELAQWLNHRQPQARVLFMSGHSESSTMRCSAAVGGWGFIPKPFTPAFVARRVREMFDPPAG